MQLMRVTCDRTTTDLSKFNLSALNSPEPPQPRCGCHDKLATDPDQFMIPSIRLVAYLRPGRNHPEFSRVIKTKIRPTYEFKDRLVTYLRPYPEVLLSSHSGVIVSRSQITRKSIVKLPPPHVIWQMSQCEKILNVVLSPIYDRVESWSLGNEINRSHDRFWRLKTVV